MCRSCGTKRYVYEINTFNMINPELKKLQVMAGILQDETQHITGDVILSEETLLEFEELWKGNIVLEGFTELNEADKEKLNAFMKIVKDMAMKLYNLIRSVGRFVWDKFWSLVVAILKTVWKNPITAIAGTLGITAWNVLVKALNFEIEIFGKTFSSDAGTGLNDQVKNAIASGWDSMSQAIGSYEAPSAGMAPLEWMANAVSAGFDAIGMAMPAFIESTQAVVGWLMTIGSFPAVQMALLWLFLIGAADWAFDTCKKLLSGFINNILKKPMEFAKQQSQDVKDMFATDEPKGLEDRSNDFADKLKGVDLKGVDVTNPGATNMNPQEKT